MQDTVTVVGRTADGETVWYTGRAGAAFVSADAAEAFRYSLDGARRRALNLNRGTAAHGIWFVACVGSLAPAVAGVCVNCKTAAARGSLYCSEACRRAFLNFPEVA